MANIFGTVLWAIQKLVSMGSTPVSNDTTDPDQNECPVPDKTDDPFPISTDTAIEKTLTPAAIQKLVFPYTKLSNIELMLPIVLQALKNRGLQDTVFTSYSIATIAVENDKFYPIAEEVSKWNTDKDPFDKYVGKLGNKDLAAASLYRGSGLIQLTGYSNYQHMDNVLKLDGGLVKQGYVAGNEPHIAGVIFVEFLHSRESVIREAIEARDFKKARAAVNGSAALRWEDLQAAYEKIEKLLS
jgi:predicted chitinase